MTTTRMAREYSQLSKPPARVGVDTRNLLIDADLTDNTR